MTHLFNEADFSEDQELTLVQRRYSGEELSRTAGYKVIRIERGTCGKMKGTLKVTVRRPDGYVLTVLPREDGRGATLEV